jgi:hypothetical protein
MHAAITHCTCSVSSGTYFSETQFQSWKILGGDSNVCYILGRKRKIRDKNVKTENPY